MVQALSHPDVPSTNWLQPFVSDFKSRFIALLAGAFKEMPPALALSLLNPKLVFSEAQAAAGVQEGVLVTRGDGRQLSPYDLKRLQVCVWGGGTARVGGVFRCV
jgi:N-acetyltransferase 10